MALKGNLTVFSTTQLLNLINLSKRSGSLTIFEGIPTGKKLTLGDGETKIEELAPGKELATLSFKEGKLIYAEMDGKDGHLAMILQRAGKLNEEQSKLIRQRAASMSDRGLALRLINANYVTQKDIIQSIQKHTVSIVFDLINWKKEPFSFNEDKSAPDSRIHVPIDLKNVIIEATRIQNESVKLEEEIRDLDMALAFAEDPSEFRKVKLGANEWRVVGFINPKNSIRQIAKACNMTDTEIRRVVYTLLHAGLVKLVKPETQEARKKRADFKKMQRNAPSRAVVNRLIDKIKSI